MRLFSRSVEGVSRIKERFFIIGPDNKKILRSLLRDGRYFYYDPQDYRVFINAYVIFWTIFYFARLRSFKSAYLTALVRAKTKVACVTLIDNSIHFFRMAKLLHKKIKIVAIQNGNRFDMRSWPKKLKREIFIPEYICFGKYEVDFFSSELQATIENYYPVGSFMEKCFRQKMPSSSVSSFIYDLCVVSECFSGYDDKYPGIEAAVGNIASYVVRYAREHNLKVVLALKYPINKKSIHGGETEIDFYKNYINIQDVFISHRDNDPWASYKTTSESFITIGMISTLILEAASRKNRVMICDFYGEPWTLELPEPLSHINYSQSYESFSTALTDLRNETDKVYWERRKELIDYRMVSNDSYSPEALMAKVIGNE